MRAIVVLPDLTHLRGPSCTFWDVQRHIVNRSMSPKSGKPVTSIALSSVDTRVSEMGSRLVFLVLLGGFGQEQLEHRWAQHQSC